jgi:hypothetical protein
VQLLRLINQRLLTLPSGIDIVAFLRHDGKAPDAVDEFVVEAQEGFAIPNVIALLPPLEGCPGCPS